MKDILPIQTISRSSGNTNSTGGASTSNNNAGTTATATAGTADVAAKKEKVEEKKESIAASTTPPITTAPITAPTSAPAPISTDVPTTTTSTDNALEMSLHVQRALQQGSKPWKRSKFSIVGEGRAGKTAFTNAIIGKSFQDTASTVGINQLTCNIKHIKTNDKHEKTENENDEQSWEECEKTERELENAIAELILNSQNNQKNNPTTTSNTNTTAIKDDEKERKNKDIRTYMKSNMNNQKKSNREYDESDSDDPSEEEESDDEESDEEGSDQEEKNNKRKNKKESSNQSKNKNNNTKISNQQNNDKKKTNSEQITKQQKKDKNNNNNNTDKQLNNSTTNNKTKKEIIPTSMTKSNEIKSEDSKVEASRELDENTVMKMLATMKDKNSGLLISLFDFGGQSVFDIIHHLFLTRNGVYALVFNMEWLINDNQNEKQKALRFMRNWLSSIAVHTFNITTKMTAPIVIVGTRLDKITNPSDHEKISTILHEHFSDNLAWRSVISNKDGKDSNGKALQWFFPVDNKAGSRSVGMKRLMTVVHEVINKAEYTHKEIPLTWLKVIDHMSDMKKDCLLLSDLKMLGERNGVSMEEVPYMLTFLHDVGHLMWLDEPGLRDVVVLDPVSYLVTPATIIICKLTPDHDDTTHHFMECHHECERMHRREWMQLKRDGILHITLLPILWADFIAHQDVLLQLMVKFGLLVPLRSASTTTSTTTAAVITQYLVPTLLSPASLTDHNIINWTDQPYSTCYLVFTLVDDLEMSPNLTEADLHSAGFLPGGMFERMIGKAISWSQDTARSSNINIQNILLYKDIAILTFGRQRFRLIHCPDLHSIRVDIEGDHPIGIQQKLLSFALKIIDECMKSLHCFTSICYKTNLGPENEEVKSLKGLLSSELLIPLLQLRKASKGESMLAWRGGRTLLTLNEIKSKYKQWLQLFDLRERYDVFISYRWGEYDSDFTERLFDMFTNYSINTNNRAVEVFLDRKRLREGRQFKSDFSAALTHCSIALPIISIDALGRMVDHNPTYCDNVLLEWIIILECFAVKRLQKVYPILFGQREVATTVLQSNEVVVKDFFMHPIKDSLSTTIPIATLEQASTLLRENGIEPSGRFNAYTVNSIVQEMLLFLLCKASDYTSTIVVEAVADKVIVLLGDCVEVLASQKTTSSGATGSSSTTNPTLTTTTTPPPSTTTTKALKELNVDEVCILLEREGLTKLINIFREKEVTGAMLTFCESAEDLKGEEFGVPGAVMARGLMKLITQWQTEGVSV